MWISAGSWQPRENWSREATMQPVMWGELRSSLCWSSISFFLSSWSHFNVVLFLRTVAGRLDNTWKAFASGRGTYFTSTSINLDQHRTTFPSWGAKKSEVESIKSGLEERSTVLALSTLFHQKAEGYIENVANWWVLSDMPFVNVILSSIDLQVKVLWDPTGVKWHTSAGGLTK